MTSMDGLEITVSEAAKATLENLAAAMDRLVAALGVASKAALELMNEEAARIKNA